MCRLLAALALMSIAAACQNGSQPVVTPSASPSPHTAPTAAILQSADIPAGLDVCAGSGPIDVYLSVLTNSDATLASKLTGQWSQLRTSGAINGAISTFAASPAACSSELGATTRFKAMSSFVAQFADEGQADRAWQAGIFGFAPPAVGDVEPGLTRGTGTGLGVSSFVYDVPGLRLACWHRSVFVALVVVSNLDLTTFKAATAAIDPRLN